MLNTFVALFTLTFTTFAFSLPHMDLEMESAEYRPLLKALQNNKGLLTVKDPAIEEALAHGERLSQWIQLINENRTLESAIRLTSAATRRGVPIDAPNIYNPKIIKAKTLEILAALPIEMKKIIVSKEDFPSNPPVDDETFIKHARLLDRNYQQAARYKSLIPYKQEYADYSRYDVRGLHFLNTNKIGKTELQDVSTINPKLFPKIKEALLKICANSEPTTSACTKKLSTAVKKNELAAFYEKYIASAQQIWDEFFIIPKTAIRTDVVWQNNIMTVPFNTPTIAKFIPYLQNNIEDEFRFMEWGLKMMFGSFQNGPELVFEPGVVPRTSMPWVETRL